MGDKTWLNISAQSAYSFPRMLVLLGTQHRWMSNPFIHSCFILYLIVATKWWSISSPATACRQEDKYNIFCVVRNCHPLQSRKSGQASVVKIELSSDMQTLNFFCWQTARSRYLVLIFVTITVYGEVVFKLVLNLYM